MCDKNQRANGIRKEKEAKDSHGECSGTFEREEYGNHAGAATLIGREPTQRLGGRTPFLESLFPHVRSIRPPRDGRPACQDRFTTSFT